MSDSAERLLETVEIELLKTRTALAGVSIVRHGESADAADSRIVVMAEAEDSLDLKAAKATNPPLVRGFRVSIDAKTVGQAPTVIDGWMTEVELANNDASASSAGLTAALALFSRLHILDGEVGDEEDSGHTRKRNRTFPVLAKLA